MISAKHKVELEITVRRNPFPPLIRIWNIFRSLEMLSIFWHASKFMIMDKHQALRLPWWIANHGRTGAGYDFFRSIFYGFIACGCPVPLSSHFDFRFVRSGLETIDLNTHWPGEAGKRWNERAEIKWTFGDDYHWHNFPSNHLKWPEPDSIGQRTVCSLTKDKRCYEVVVCCRMQTFPRTM